jgi:hypothetical protein
VFANAARSHGCKRNMSEDSLSRSQCPGLVARCPLCGHVLPRLVNARQRVFLDRRSASAWTGACSVGKREEMDFAEEARTWVGILVSEKLPRNGDFILAYRDPSGAPLEPRILVDCKNKESGVSETDIDKLVRDAKERSTPVAALVARDESQLRQVDRESRWSRKDGVWILRTTRQWLPRDLDVLKPIFERMRVQGFDLLEKNAVLAVELRRTFPEIDRIEKELGKAAKAIQSVSALVVRYRERLRELCDATVCAKIAPKPEQNGGMTAARGQ